MLVRGREQLWAESPEVNPWRIKDSAGEDQKNKKTPWPHQSIFLFRVVKEDDDVVPEGGMSFFFGLVYT